MKWISILLATCAIACAQTQEAPSSKPSNLSFRAKETGTKKQDTDNWKTDYGSYDRDTVRKKTILVEVTKFGNDPAKGVRVWALWIARSNQSGSSPYVYRREVITRDVNSQLSSIEFVSPEVTENNTNYAALGVRYVSGSKLIGYVIGMDYKDGVYRPHFSNGLSSISSPEKLKGLVDDYEAYLKSR